MGTIATVKIVNKRNGKTRIINESDWAHDLGKGKYDGWARAGSETHGDADEAARINIDEEARKAQAQRDADEQAQREREEAEAQAAAEQEAATQAQRDAENKAAQDAAESTEDDDTLTTGDADEGALS